MGTARLLQRLLQGLFTRAHCGERETMVLRPPPPASSLTLAPTSFTPLAPTSPPPHSPGSADRCSVKHALVHKTHSVRCLAAVVTAHPGPRFGAVLEKLPTLVACCVLLLSVFRYVRTTLKIRR